MQKKNRELLKWIISYLQKKETGTTSSKDLTWYYIKENHPQKINLRNPNFKNNIREIIAGYLGTLSRCKYTTIILKNRSRTIYKITPKTIKGFQDILAEKKFTALNYRKNMICKDNQWWKPLKDLEKLDMHFLGTIEKTDSHFKELYNQVTL